MLDEWLIAVDTTTPFCVGARSGVVTTCDSFENSTWGATAAGTCADQALRHDYVATLASTSPLRSASSAYRYLLREMKASLGQNVTNWSSLSETSDNARRTERFKYVVCHWPKSPGTSRDGTSGPGECHPVYLNVYFRPSWFWIVRTMTNVGIARSAVRRICQEVEYRMK